MDVGKKIYNLTGVQEAIFASEQFCKGTSINNITGMFYINNKIDITALSEALKLFIKNNSGSRIQIGLSDTNEPFQYFENYTDLTFETVYPSNLEEASSLTQKITDTPIFDFNSRLYDFKLFKLPDSTGGFISTFHHLISDAWSMQLFIDIIVSNYYKLTHNGNELVSMETYEYKDYIDSYTDYLKSSKYIKDKEFWKENFSSSSTPITLHSDTNQNVEVVTDYSAERLNFTLNSNIMKKLSPYLQENKISAYAFFLAVHSIYFSRINNSQDFVIGTPVLNRTNVKEKNTTGLFINTIPFSVNINNKENFSDFVRRISVDTMSYFRHQKYPYQNILSDIRNDKDNSSINNLYNVLYSYQNARAYNSFGDINYKAIWFQPKYIINDIQIHIHDILNSGNLSISYDYRTSKFSENLIKSTYNRIIAIVNQILDAKENIKISDIEIVTPAEKKKLLYTFNNTHKEYDKNKTIQSLIEEQCDRFPNKIALICNDKKISYRELNSRANQIAHYLRSLGVKPNTFVGLLCDRSLEMIIGQLGILKSGAAYLPIDPDYPSDRISYMIENSEAKIVLSKENLFNLISSNSNDITKLDISLENSIIYKSSSCKNPKNINSSEDLAYIIYTSGSTGNPKGVQLKHININNFILGTTDKIKFSDDKTIISVTTICFDIFVLESLLPLQNGLTIVIANEKEQNNINFLNDLCLKYNVNIIQTTPSRLNKLTNDIDYCRYINNLTDILVGGEPLPITLLEHLRKLTKKARIYNMYGPTETAVWSTIKDVSNYKSSTISIGTPIANTSIYVLDEKTNKLLPPGNPGILYIGGDGVCKGYHKRENLNKTLFINNPYNNNEIIYNTNDLVKQLPNGELIHLGRADFQVKIRGYRIELGEIENKILSYDNINETVLVPHESKFLICYYSSSKDIIISELISYLLEYLPNYMIPAYFIKLPNLPLTPNGKIDRKKLPKPNMDSEQLLEIASTNTEKILEENILKILNNGMEHIDINTPFISLGLDSLSIVQLQSMLLGYQLNITTQTFYKFPTVKKLAKYIDSSKNINENVSFTLDPMFLHNKDEKAIISNDSNDLGNVFLTGANGFIGIHVLKELLDTTNCNIYCLVRGANLEISTNRLSDNFKYYFNLSINPYLNKRVFIINGDITNENLVMSNEINDMLGNNINTVIHTAAVVKHYGNFDEFKEININGTKNIAKFAFKNHIRFIHISSISISGNYLLKQDNHNVEFSENDFYIGQNYTENVYVNSKLEAENVIYSYMKKGLQGKVLRIGIVAGRYSDGLFQKNMDSNAFYSRIKSVTNLKVISEDMINQKIEFTPIDECAKAIVLLSKTKQYDNKIFHLYNHNLVSINNVIKTLKKLNINVEVLSSESFKEKVLEATKAINNAVSAIVNDFDYTNLSLNYNFTVNIKSEYSIKILHDLGFSWSKLNNDYLYRIFNYMITTGFISKD